MWIMIAGPYRSGTESEREWEQNLRALNREALEILRKGHVPVIGVNLALPMVDVAGSESYDEIVMSLSLAIADRCDAVLRVGGPSEGADAEVDRIRARGGQVFHGADEVPELHS
jgi:hypothetical protein